MVRTLVGSQSSVRCQATPVRETRSQRTGIRVAMRQRTVTCAPIHALDRSYSDTTSWRISGSVIDRSRSASNRPHPATHKTTTRPGARRPSRGDPRDQRVARHLCRPPGRSGYAQLPSVRSIKRAPVRHESAPSGHGIGRWRGRYRADRSRSLTDRPSGDFARPIEKQRAALERTG